MSRAVADLLAILDLEQLEVNLFRGQSPKSGWQRVFGGQVIGQALVAATRTVDGRHPHSLHGYFMLPGDPKVPIIYEVDRIRDGKSFTTRRVVAIQHGQAIFSMSASFHLDEEGFAHQAEMPKVPGPDELPSEEEVKGRAAPADAGAHAHLLRARAAARNPARGDQALSVARSGRAALPCLDQDHRPPARRSGDPPMRARLCLGHDAPRHLAHSPRPHGVRAFDPGRRASTTPCGSTGPSAPTNGCSMRRTPRAPAVPAASPADSFLSRTAPWSPRLRRKASSASAELRSLCLKINQ